MSDTSFDGQGITAGTELILSPASPLPPASLFTPTPEAARRVLEFFTAQINNGHTTPGLPERRAALRRLVRGPRHRSAHRRAGLPRRPLIVVAHTDRAGRIRPAGVPQGKAGLP